MLPYRMITKVRGLVGKMEQTGAGIESASEIDMTLNNSLTNLWGALMAILKHINKTLTNTYRKGQTGLSILL